MSSVLVSDITQVSVISNVLEGLAHRRAKHGCGAYSSGHQTYGILAEEMMEFLEALRMGGRRHIRDELLDIAVAAVYGVASMDAQETATYRAEVPHHAV